MSSVQSPVVGTAALKEPSLYEQNYKTQANRSKGTLTTWAF